MSHIFISYAHSDQIYARKLADYLLANGFDVWIDDRIDFGTRWMRAIFEAVDSCDAFIVIMTPESYEREWVEKEYLRAADQKKPSFPLLLNGKVFPFFVGIQYYDVRGEKLPEKNFLERLAKFAPRSGVQGQDVASVPQEQAKYHARQPRRASFVLAGAGVIVALAVVIVLALSARNNSDSSRTPTPSLTQQTGNTASQVAAVPSDLPTRVNTIAPNQTDTAVPTVSLTQTENMPPAIALLATFAAPSSGAQGEIAFQSNRDGNMEIYLMDTNGGHVQRLTNNPKDDTLPAWSPDGTQIIFTGGETNNETLYIMNADGSNLHPLGVNRIGWNASWSPDGKKIVFTGYGNNSPEIYVADIEGGNAQALTNDLTNDDYPRWSPDGTQIVFESERDGNQEIYVMNADGGHVRRLTDNAAVDINPAWSPDGSQIVFESNRGGYSQLYLMAADGSNPHHISSDPKDSYKPDWSPDGSQIVFTSYRESNTEEIYIMDADGSNVRRLTNNRSDDTFPAWRP